MKKMSILFILSCLPFTQMASVAMCLAPDVFEETPAAIKASPELPLNTLYCFIQ